MKISEPKKKFPLCKPSSAVELQTVVHLPEEGLMAEHPVFLTDLLCAMGFGEEICPARLHHSYMKHH